MTESKLPRTVVVTGGAGFIGSHLADALIAKGLRVRVVDNFTTGHRQYLNPDAELLTADIRDARSLPPYSPELTAFSTPLRCPAYGWTSRAHRQRRSAALGIRL